MIQASVLGLGGSMKPLAVIAGCVVTIANLLILIFILSSSHWHSRRPAGPAFDSYDAISVQLTILSIVIAAVGIGLAVAAFFGYQALQAIVLAKADELISERFNRLERERSPKDDVKAFTEIPPTADVSKEAQKL